MSALVIAMTERFFLLECWNLSSFTETSALRDIHPLIHELDIHLNKRISKVRFLAKLQVSHIYAKPIVPIPVTNYSL